MASRKRDLNAPSQSDQSVDFAGYSRCPVLINDHARVVLGPHAGGRLLDYSVKGVSALYRDSSQDGWTWAPGRPPIDPCGGRLDVGPEMVLPPHPNLWLGPWHAESLGKRRAHMTSVEDDATGLQLLRDFALDEHSSHLRVTQTMNNLSGQPVDCYHWSRTLVEPGGLAVVPLTEPSRFPRKHLMYTPEGFMNFRPEDPNVSVRDGFFLVEAPPKYPKLVLDSCAGWFAYLMTNDLLFVKRFPVYPDRVYGDLAGATVCIYYHPRFCELEPIGPRERLQPGGSASFTEDWWLLEYKRPSGPVDLDALTNFVSANTSA